MKRKCELCSNEATIYCGSDKASLCYECDSKVHSANFLVAKHLRTLLCRVCQCPTPWAGSGPKLGPTISVCKTCLSARRHIGGIGVGVHHHDDQDHDRHGGSGDEDEDDDLDDDEEEEEEDYDDEEDNQVVPWSYPMSHPR